MLSFGILPALLKYPVKDCVRRAAEYEKAGFEVLWEGDHFLPWYHTEGHAADAYVALTAYLQTTGIKSAWMGCPCIRQQPADVALRISTMAALYPGRVILGVGTGEQMNEKAVTGRWPSTRERIERLVESIELIRKLWTATEFFRFKGKYFDTQGLIYDRPESPIPIFVAASGKRMMEIAGRYGDGFITIAPPSLIKNELIPAFERGAREAGKDPSRLERCAWICTSFHPDSEQALKIARKFAGLLIPECYTVQFDPRVIEARALLVRDDAMKEVFIIATTPDEIISGVEKYVNAGITHIILDEISPDPSLTPKIYREKVIPYFREKR
jgi:coenzyme F420-dependent glucose-6-phosphate dehydrogenase